MQNPFNAIPTPTLPNAADHHLMRPINQRLPNTNSINNSNSASLPSHSNGGSGMNEASFRPASVINLSHSNDVVIGPMTQYQGSVTIYQYMDATVEATVGRMPGSNGLGIRSNNITKEIREDKCTIFDKKHLQTWILVFVLMVITAGVAVAIFLSLRSSWRNGEQQQPREILFGNEYEDNTIPNLGNGHLVIDRKQWGAANIPNEFIKKLEHPIPYVLITHIGVQSKPCDNVYNCSIKMRTIQDSAIAEKKWSDLPANFYVSNDGYVYVGRGWNNVNEYNNRSLAICFMGDYMRYKPSPIQLDGVRYLLAYGLARQFIQIDYRLVAHNQTRTTKSPGVNVYTEILKLPHWYPCGIGDVPKCEI